MTLALLLTHSKLASRTEIVRAASTRVRTCTDSHQQWLHELGRLKKLSRSALGSCPESADQTRRDAPNSGVWAQVPAPVVVSQAWGFGDQAAVFLAASCSVRRPRRVRIAVAAGDHQPARRHVVWTGARERHVARLQRLARDCATTPHSHAEQLLKTHLIRSEVHHRRTEAPPERRTQPPGAKSQLDARPLRRRFAEPSAQRQRRSESRNDRARRN